VLILVRFYFDVVNKNTNFSRTKCFKHINCQNVLFLLQGWCAYSGASISGQRRRLRGLRVDHSVPGPAGEAQAKKNEQKTEMASLKVLL
jgi:hypothetical protein